MTFHRNHILQAMLVLMMSIVCCYRPLLSRSHRYSNTSHVRAAGSAVQCIFHSKGCIT